MSQNIKKKKIKKKIIYKKKKNLKKIIYKKIKMQIKN